MKAYIKKNFLNLLTCLVFVVAAILAIIALAQNLRPIDAIVSAQKRIIDITANETLKNTLTESIKNFNQIHDILLMSYLATIMFLTYMIAVRVLKLCGKQIPKIILPVVAAANILLLLIAAYTVGDFGAGLGLSPTAETVASGYTWYARPDVMADNNTICLAPTFWTIVFPMIFCGILPLITGLKAYIYNEPDKNR